MTHNDYTFGDHATAAERLEALAEVFNPTSHEFLRRHGPPRPRLCLELGSGPGLSTRMIHSALAPEALIALDASPRLLARAREHVPQGVRCVEHDVTAPLPVQDADAIVSRFIVTHIDSPQVAIRGWLDALAAAGRLLLEETAELVSDNPELCRYYELVGVLQRAAGQDLYVGRRLAELVEQAEGRVVHASLDVLLIPACRMARLHSLNLPTLRQRDVVKERYDDAELDALQRSLERIAQGASEATVRVTMGRCVASRG